MLWVGALAIGALFVASGAELPVRAVIVGAVVATVLEATTISIDDNLTIPLGAGASMVHLAGLP